VAALVGAAIALLAVEVALGAIHHGRVELQNPCVERSAFRGGGLDGAVQQLALDGLDGAACRLGTSREELVLSLSPGLADKPVRWDPPTIAQALTAGFDRAVHQAADRGGLEGIAARVIGRLRASAILDWLLGRLSG
jgi:hypothetical protein